MNLDRLVADAEHRGWNDAYFDYCRGRMASGLPPAEDDRVADWRFFVSIPKDATALVLGGGFGTVVHALSAACDRVHVADPDPARLRLLELRQQALGVRNVTPIAAQRVASVSLTPGSVDVMSYRASDWQGVDEPFRDIARRAGELLRPGGVFALTLPNRLSFARLLGRSRDAAAPSSSRHQYARELKAAGFGAVDSYAVLPDHDVAPLFWVPLETAEPFAFFVKSLYGLFDTASPEAKRRYGALYALATAGVKMARRFRVTRIAAHFVPAVGIIAHKEPQTGRASSC